MPNSQAGAGSAGSALVSYSSSRLGPRTTYMTTRPVLLSIGKILTLALTNAPFIKAAPSGLISIASAGKPDVKPASDPTLWIYLSVALVLVLLGGVFAGLTIALMGQDDVNLQVIHESGEGKEKNHAGSVLRLLQRGKHWVLVTLLLSNVITNETLPIVLDRSLGGGWPAVLSSTVLIVIFGEIIPQSICVRYGLTIGSWMSPLVLGLMYLLSPVAWPTAKLLDRLLGEDHGTVYKKAGLKTLVTLHKTLGDSANERLNQDEVTIISAVLDLKDKPVGSIMTPMEDTFTMAGDTILDENMMDIILSAGYSRIPIYAADDHQNYIGMLLVKTLITYDPEDCKRVSDFALATLPETRPETSCLDIVNFFQEGKSHMVLVSDSPGENYGALGVVTLEDVIEELIGEEIIDESDVFVDVHKAVRRKTPAPKLRIPRVHVNAGADKVKKADEGLLIEVGEDLKGSEQGDDQQSRGRYPAGASPRRTESIRDQSSTLSSGNRPPAKRGSTGDLREQWKHLGPSNLASRPRQTRYNTVKIKTYTGGGPDSSGPQRRPSEEAPGRQVLIPASGGTEPTLVNSANKESEDGTLSMQAGYGSITSPSSSHQPSTGIENSHANQSSNEPHKSSNSKQQKRPPPSSSKSGDTLTVLQPSQSSRSSGSLVVEVRSGNITENIIEAGGFRKVVLETNSSSDDVEANNNERSTEEDEDTPHDPKSDQGEQNTAGGGEGGKKKRRRRRKKQGDKNTEETPLLRKGED